MKRKLFLVFHGRFPSEKAAALFAANSAEAFADKGLSVVLVVPRRLGRLKESAFKFYGLKENFKVVFLPTVDFFKIPFLKRVAFSMSFISFSLFSFLFFLWRAKRDDIVYSNESLPLLMASFAFPQTVYEIHDFPRNNFYYKVVFRRVASFIATNRWKKGKLLEIFKISEEKITVEQNAVSLEEFGRVANREEARKTLRLPLDTKLVCYVGALRTMGMEKGIGILLEAFKSVAGCQLLVVGGSTEDVEFYKKVAHDYGIIDRIIFTGFVSHKQVPPYLRAADILVAPFPKSDHYEFYMSPMKIFEYMAIGRPIVASDLSAIREILDETMAVLVKPDDQKSLEDGIRRLLTDDQFGRQIAGWAYEKVLDYTWDKRAERILNFLWKSI